MKTKNSILPNPMKISEAEHQQALLGWTSLQWWGEYLIYIPNEFPVMHLNYGFKLLSKRKKMGCKKGVPDLFLALPNSQFNGLWLELKSSGQKPRPEQKEWLTKLAMKGYAACWSNRLSDSIAILIDYTQKIEK